MRSLIDDDKQGVFAAKCETTSLISGMIFTMVMGRLVDTFEEAGNISGAFVVIGITIFVLSLLNFVMLLFIKEKPKPEITPVAIQANTILKSSLLFIML